MEETNEKVVAAETESWNVRLEKKLDESIILSKKVYEQNIKIKRRLTLIILGGYLKLLMVIVPIILAVIFLQPILNTALQQYNSLLGGDPKSNTSIFDILNNPEVKNLLSEQKKK